MGFVLKYFFRLVACFGLGFWLVVLGCSFLVDCFVDFFLLVGCVVLYFG